MKHIIGNNLLVVALVPFLLSTSCSKEPAKQGSRMEENGMVIESVEVGTTDRVHRADAPDLYIASQPGPDDLQKFKSLGIKTVINLRRPEETPDINEETLVTDLEMTYINPGFSSPDELNNDIFDRVRMELKQAGRPVLLHCSSANRASAVWLPYRVLDEGIPLEQAQKEAETMGLRSRKLTEKAHRYIKEKQSE